MGWQLALPENIIYAQNAEAKINKPTYNDRMKTFAAYSNICR